ncbi:MAG: choice-of-anchor D domain-containing protein [Lysobacterales bacterium]
MNFRCKILAAAIASSLVGHHSARSATITVNSKLDALTGTPAGVCTLRQAIESANQRALIGDCVSGSAVEPDVVTFAPTLAGNTITLTEGAINIASSLTLESPPTLASQVTISGGNNSGIFRISNNLSDIVTDVTLRGLALTNGTGFSFKGGAVDNYLENVTIDACTLSGNSVNGDGGAIYTRGSMTLIDTIVDNNYASGAGGGVRHVGGTLTLVNSTISNNVASEGGGISSAGSVVTIDGGSLSRNTAFLESGGGILATDAVYLTGVSVSQNYAMFAAGGISGTPVRISGGQVTGNTAGSISGGGSFGSLVGDYSAIVGVQVSNNVALGGFGGAFSVQGNLNISDSTFSENSAAGNAGALFFGGYGVAVVRNSEFDNNSAAGAGGAVSAAGYLSIFDSTLSRNTASNGAAINHSEGLLYWENVTASYNVSSSVEADLNPAAVFSRAQMVISASTLVGNAPFGLTKVGGGFGTVTLRNSVIVDSSIGDCSDVDGIISENVANFVADGSCNQNAVDLLVGDPMLGPLFRISETNSVHFPEPGSVLVDSGSASECAMTDQTGIQRPVDGNADGFDECDRGSVEYVDVNPPIAALSALPDIILPGGTGLLIDVTYTELDSEVDLFTIDPSDIRVLPGPLSVTGVSLTGTNSQVTATYEVAVPGGSWDLTDNGDYDIVMQEDAVNDIATTGANAVLPGLLGSFSVAIIEMNLQGAGNTIADGDESPSAQDGTDLGEVMQGKTATRTFTVTNVGAGVLNLTSLEVLGPGFTLNQPDDTMLSAGESTDFQVEFSPAALGTASGQVIILNNDVDENPYTFAVGATGIALQENIFTNGFEAL